MREVDRLTSERYGIPSLQLMENAAIAVARTVTRLVGGDVEGRSVLVLCGRGNNGGDGAATARLLALAGARVDVVLIGRFDQLKGDARINFERLQIWKENLSAQDDSATAQPGNIELYECESEKAWLHLQSGLLSINHEAIVDALFGTGLSRPVDGVYQEVIKWLNDLREPRATAPETPNRILSIDIPSGLDSDSAELIGDTVTADVTVTMTAPKLANVLPPGASHNGELIVADIGSPSELIDERGAGFFLMEAVDARRWLIRTRYTPESYKNMHGHALVIAGSRGFTGAAALCGNAAMRAGAGLVTVATPVSVQPLVATLVMPEVMTTSLVETDRGAVSDEALDYILKFAARCTVIGVGPGLSSEDERTRSFVRELVKKRQVPMVIDADALNCLAPWPDDLKGSNDRPIVLTPHPGEMLRLMGEKDKSALNDRVSVAREFAEAHQVILVLKGTRALIAAPHGQLFVNPTGNAGLGTAGAGDTLTGIISGFLAQAYGTLGTEADVVEAVIAAVYVGGFAGDLAARELGMRTMTASDIPRYISAVIKLLDRDGELPKRFQTWQ